MKRIIFFSVFLLSIMLPLGASAAIFKGGNQVDIGAGQVINDDVYIAGGTVNSSSIVQGDIIAAGGAISIMGSTTQDVIVAGGSVTITGNVGDDLRAAGGNITVSGNVVDDAIIAGGQVTLTSGSSVGGDTIITGGTVTLNGVIHGNVQVTTGRLIIGSSAVIGGNLIYTADQQAQIQSGAQIRGETQFNQTQKSKTSVLSGTSIILKFVSLFIIALLIQWLFRRRVVNISTDAGRGIWGNIGRGFVTLIIAPVLIVIAFITVIGIPLGFIALLLYITLIAIAYLLVPIAVGAWVMKYYRKSEVFAVDWKSALIGTLIIVVLGIIPIVGWIINGVLLLIVFGTLVKGLMFIVRREKDSNVELHNS